ncbi:MAG: serine/threonine protein kinase [Lachnospiraceae bacterium]|nr:serine/threonine protein kinase [Lachnospiraceae bacterium]
MSESILEILGGLGIGTAITGFVVWLIKEYIKSKRTQKEEKIKQEEQACEQKEKELMEFRCMQMKVISACVILSEATARAVQRIPDAKCNGDMHKALNSTEEIKNELDNFMSSRGMNHLFGGQ